MILAQYKIGTTFSNYGFIILIFYGLYLFFIKKKKLIIHKQLLWLTTYVTIISTVNMIRLDDFSVTWINRTVMPLLLFFTISIVIDKLNYKNFYKSYLIVGSIAMVIMYFLSIRLLAFGIPARPITILPISPEDAHFWGNFMGRRPSGLFTEPQAYASFMLPLLVLTLQQKKRILGLVISFSILLSTSSLGIIMVGIIYLYFIILGKIKMHQKILLFITIALIIYTLLNLNIFEFAATKIAETELEDNIRLTRGFVVYSSFDLPELLMGINQNLQEYILNNVTDWWVQSHIQSGSEHLLGYTTTVSGLLVQYGLFAGIIFFIMMYKMFKYEDKSNRILLLVIFILSFAQTLFYNGWFVFYYIIYMGLCNKKIFDRNYKKIKVKY